MPFQRSKGTRQERQHQGDAQWQFQSNVVVAESASAFSPPNEPGLVILIPLEKILSSKAAQGMFFESTIPMRT